MPDSHPFRLAATPLEGLLVLIGVFQYTERLYHGMGRVSSAKLDVGAFTVWGANTLPQVQEMLGIAWRFSRVRQIGV